MDKLKLLVKKNIIYSSVLTAELFVKSQALPKTATVTLYIMQCIICIIIVILVTCSATVHCTMAGHSPHQYTVYTYVTETQFGVIIRSFAGANQYIFLEASGLQPGDQAILRVPTTDILQPRCITFFYHMYSAQGNEQGSLSVANAINRISFWMVSGNQCYSFIEIKQCNLDVSDVAKCG